MPTGEETPQRVRKDFGYVVLQGKHRRKSFREALNQLLQEHGVEMPDGTVMPLGDRLLSAVVTAAFDGDMKAAQIILDRLDPCPKNSITINNQVTPSAIIEELRNVNRRIVADEPQPTTNGKGNGRCH